MRDFELDEPAALVYCPFRAMLHLPTWSDKRRVFERVAAALAPGGRFVWNSFVFNPRIAAANDGVWEVQPASATASTTSPATTDSTSRSSPAAASRSGG